MAQPEFLNVKTRSVSRLFYIAQSVLIHEHRGVLAQRSGARTTVKIDQFVTSVYRIMQNSSAA
jgi:hypothetical protein